MSRPQYGNDMDRPSTGDIIRRARERAEAGLPREDYETFLRRQAAANSASPSSTPEIPPRSRPPLGSPDSGFQRQQRPQAPPGFQGKDGQVVLPISRPAPVPQWPLSGPLVEPATDPDALPYKPPAGSSPPQRPPRPSHVPSLLDASRLQDPTPSFQYQPRSSIRDSEGVTSSVPETPSTLSRPSTLSSVGSIPDFPLPIQLPIQAPPPPTMGPPRRSMNLGPPPSARRGASSFYSHLSYVSPIPEESPRRSHTSYASSAAMPESWGTPSPMDSPRFEEGYYEDTIVEEMSQSEAMSMQEEEGDESRLVRSASIGRRGKAALVTTPSREFPQQAADDELSRPFPSPVQPSPFNDGTGYLDASSNSSNTVPSSKGGAAAPVGAALTADAILTAYDAASAVEPRASRRLSKSPNTQADSRGYSRWSAIRRPPKLDIDAVRQAETRGSLTSLPDLIRRATRLAASLDKGRRPASRFDMDDFPPEFYGAANFGGASDKKVMNAEQDSDEYYDERHRSGLSDMLAAFPPPAQAQSRTGVRQSIRESVLSWPLPPLNGRDGSGSPRSDPLSGSATPDSQKKGRRCCGLPLWVPLALVMLILVAAAVIIPIEFFVIRKQNTSTNNTAAAEQQCQNQLTCQNGGSNVVTNGICSCICTNGFTGLDCSTADTVGCTTTTIAGDTNISNVTLGNAIPRLLTQASTNFSITLSETSILSKLNAGNLSCSSQNALVTFDGQNTRSGAASDVVVSSNSAGSIAQNVVEAVALNENVATVTVMTGLSFTTTLTLAGGVTSLPPTTTVTITKTLTSSFEPSSTLLTTSTTALTSSTATTATAIPATTSAAAFTVTEEVLDFARVGVLLVLQQDSLSEATTAQTSLQNFFSSGTAGLTITAASNISLSSGNSIDLVNFHVDAGSGLVGQRVTSARRDLGLAAVDLWS